MEGPVGRGTQLYWLASRTTVASVAGLRPSPRRTASDARAAAMGLPAPQVLPGVRGETGLTVRSLGQEIDSGIRPETRPPAG